MTKKATEEVDKVDSQLPSTFVDYGEDFGDGLQDVGTDEVGIPFLKILQAQSPEVIGPEDKIEGAVAGLLFNTGTMNLSKEVVLVPAMREHVFVEWRQKKLGGGRVANHSVDSPVVKAAQAASSEFGKYKTEDGNDLVETYYVYCVVLENDVPAGMVVVPFWSTSIKIYREKIMRPMRYFMVPDANGRKRNPPIYSHRLKLRTIQTSNDKGTWSTYVPEFLVDNNIALSSMKPDHEGYQAAKSLKSLLQEGKAKADFEKEDRSGGNDEDGGAAF